MTSGNENEFEYIKSLCDYLDKRFPVIFFRMQLPDGKYKIFSKNVEKIFGFRSEDIYKKPIFIKDVIHPDFLKEFESVWDNVKQGEIPKEIEFALNDAYGKKR